MSINLSSIEKKWQKAWERAKISHAEPKKGKNKFFMIFAYPGISGFLHVGHMRGFTYTDTITRFKRMNSHVVLFPAGTHASGNQAISFSAKIQRKDPAWIDYLKKNGCSEKDIPQLSTPEGNVKFFNKKYQEVWKNFGFLIDERRFTSTILPEYNAFIEWQFQKLREKNLLIQKPYYATYCPNCGPVAVDPSETDISKGGHAEKVEFTLLKYKYEDAYIVAATLRPETIFGQTNLWINPEASYVKVQVGKEKWIMSKAAAEKLMHQIKEVKIISSISPDSIIGKKALFTYLKKSLTILPASFVDQLVGTGIVTSVPSDAPFDYLALKEVKENKTLQQKYNITYEELQQLQPIQIIIQPGYGKFPAEDICSQMHLINLSDKKKIEEATKILYKKGYHTGIMFNNANRFSSMKVEEAKEAIKTELTEENHASYFYDLTEEVICRCGARVLIKRLEDQWFIQYSSHELKEKAKHHTKGMHITPLEYKQNLPQIIDWFDDRACARLGNWLGTKLPFDKKWIVEPIADSTLYPIFYIIAKYANLKKLKPSQCTPEFFDFVLLNKTTRNAPALWKKIQQEVKYFYPLDINLGGKEHQTVHFPVFLMNHIAILPKEYWPKGIFVNWWVTGKGDKISKSKGGAEPITDAIKKYSVDALRLYYCHIASTNADIVWDSPTVLNYRSSIEKIYSIVNEAISLKKNISQQIDSWLTSMLHIHTSSITSAMNRYDLRQAADELFFIMPKNLRWYFKRGGSNKIVVRQYINIWVTMMAPFTPHIAEELWHKLGNKSLISVIQWPSTSKLPVNQNAVASEKIISQLIEDILAVKKLVKFSPKKATLYVAEPWKFDLFTELKKEKNTNPSELMKTYSIQYKHGQDLFKLLQAFSQRKLNLNLTTTHKKEISFLKEASDFISKETALNVVIADAENSKEPKSKQSIPGKPAIVLS